MFRAPNFCAGIKPAFVILAVMLVCSCSKKTGARTEQILGTVCTVDAFENGTKDLYGELFSRLKEIDARFSANSASSDISRINSAAGKKAVAVHDDVYFVIESAVKYASLSGGLFDPTIGPLVKLWGIGTGHEKVPSQNEIETAVAKVDYKKIRLNKNEKKDSSTVMLAEEGMALDLGGIAKGYAADELARILSEHNIPSAIIDLGGNIYAFGNKSDYSPWRIGIKNPDRTSDIPALLYETKTPATVVTSGVYERFFIKNDVRYHHILNPRTGRPSQSGILSSTIIASSSMAADALSTISFLMGQNEFFRRMGTSSVEFEGVIFILPDNRAVASRSLKKKLSAYDSEFRISFADK